MKQWRAWRSVGLILVLLLLCLFMTVSAMTRLEGPVFTQVYYEQNNDTEEHVVYFYVIHNVEHGWGDPFRFCFSEQPAIDCTLQTVERYDQYSILMENEKHKWNNGKRTFGRYCVELMELRFVIPEAMLQQGTLRLNQGKVYFSENYYCNLDLGQVLVHPAGVTVPTGNIQPVQPMTYISVDGFSEHPYFSDFDQLWSYLQIVS